MMAEDHVAVPVAIGGCAEVRCIAPEHLAYQLFGIGQVRVGMPAAEIRQRHGVDDGPCRRAELALDQGLRIRPGHRMHSVEAHGKARAKQRHDGIEIE